MTDGNERKDVRIAMLLALTCTIVFVVLGAVLHRTSGVGGELDDYEGRALRMANGLDAGDPFHPYGVPLAILAGVHCGLSALAAGRLVSALGAGALIAATYLLCRSWAGRGTALLMISALATAEIVVVNAQLASSDMPAAGLLAIALSCWQRLANDTDTVGARRCFVGFLAFGLAVACRQASLLVFGGVLPLLLFVPRRTAVARLACALFGIGIGLLPHIVASRLFGVGPPHPGNAANVVLKYGLSFDFERFNRMDVDAIYADLHAHWLEYLQRGLADLPGLFVQQLASSIALLPTPYLAVPLSLLLTAALLAGLLRSDRGTRVLAWSALTYGTLLSLTFTASDRFLLPLLPALLPLTLAAAGRLGRAPAFAMATLLTTVSTVMLPDALRRFVEMQVDDRLTTLRELVQVERRPLVFLTDFSHRAGVSGALLVDRLAGWRSRPPSEQVAWLLDRVATANADYVVAYGRASLAEFVARVRSATLPDGWRILRDDAVFVLRIPPTPSLGDWQTQVVRASAEHVMTFRVPALPSGAEVVAASIFVMDPTGETQILPAARRTDGAYEVRAPTIPRPVGKYVVTPIVLVEPGGMLRGAPLAVSLTD